MSNYDIAEALQSLKNIVEWDYHDATDGQLRDLIGKCFEVVDQAKAEIRDRHLASNWEQNA